MSAEKVKSAISQNTDQPSDSIRVSLRPPLKFQSNNLYDVWIEEQHLIAKEYLRENERAGASEREYKALRLLEASGIAPKPVFHDSSYEKPIVVYEFVEGELWDRQRLSSKDLEKG